MSGRTEPSESRGAARRISWRERFLGPAALVLGRPRGAAGERWRRGSPVLLYHRVYADDVPRRDAFGVTRRAFERHVGWLLERYALLTVGGLHSRLGSSAEDRAPIASITFDDGYDCTEREAWPVLRRHGVAATLFVDTGRLDGPRPALTSAEVAAMASEGLEVASHGVSHANMTTLAPDDLAAELRDSRRALEEIVGGPVRGFAPPYGRYDAATIEAAHAARYDYMCTCRQHQTNLPNRAEPFLLDRLEVNRGDDTRRLARKLEGRYARVYEAWYRLGRDTRHWVAKR